MATIRLPTDFSDFLGLLNSERVEYLVVGGYAVGFHGHPRATGDLDIWIAATAENAPRVVEALVKFGFERAAISPELLMTPRQVIRMGVPPLRIELLTSVSGLDFAATYPHRIEAAVGGLMVAFIDLDSLKTNKQASGRAKDLSDLEHLP